ncbi:phytanoyl-CoA dioxygenase family protein [Micromonospora fluostatini]|uniref:phytanoyl-CoA dioxygenase family protein n=1 Tax=Micromonospora sp. JCM 30529 TaxID=3421643 RepID=UPI003D165D6D
MALRALTPDAPARTGPAPLSTAQVEQFHRDGFLVLPGFLPDDLVTRLRPEVDRWVDEGLRARSIACAVDPAANGLPPVLELELPAHGALIAHPPLLELLARLMGPSFVFHHLHSDRQEPDRPGKPWHHDYEQHPQTDRTFTMIHTLHYLDGLTEDTASLVVLPGSHREVAAKDARAGRGTDPLPGELVLDRLPVGSTVVLHSALFHARRALPEGRGTHRYFLDSSYCQTGRRWPPVKPYWRYALQRARDLRLDGGRWPELFAERHFTEYEGPA